jgi:large subunit ribosomal protein L20
VPRVKRGTKRRNSRKKTLALAKGFFLTKSKLYRSAQEAVEKSLRYGYKGRRLKKRDFRSLWIVRIGAACRTAEISYSRFMDGLKKAGVDLNRKVLADIALSDPAAFNALVSQAKTAVTKVAAENHEHGETAIRVARIGCTRQSGRPGPPHGGIGRRVAGRARPGVDGARGGSGHRRGTGGSKKDRGRGARLA